MFFFIIYTYSYYVKILKNAGKYVTCHSKVIKIRITAYALA